MLCSNEGGPGSKVATHVVLRGVVHPRALAEHQVPLQQDGCRGFTSGEHFVVHAINKAGHGNLAKILSFKTAAEADAVGDYLAGISTSPAAKAAHDSAMSAVVATVNGVGRTRTACSL